MASVQVRTESDHTLLTITEGVGGASAQAKLTAKDAQTIGEALFRSGRIMEAQDD